MNTSCKVISALAVVLAGAACNPDQRETVDSAAGSAVDVARSELSVIDVDMGRRSGDDRDVADKTDTFAQSDTIFASVLTSGTAEKGAMVSRWTFPDGSVVDQQADSAAKAGRLLFFIAKPGGLDKGKYTFQVLVDGREVRTKDVTVQ